jgi:hypothetical protein
VILWPHFGNQIRIYVKNLFKKIIPFPEQVQNYRVLDVKPYIFVGIYEPNGKPFASHLKAETGIIVLLRNLVFTYETSRSRISEYCKFKPLFFIPKKKLPLLVKCSNL